MPDRRKHRGAHPDDEHLFDERHHQALRIAVAEFSRLLTRGYAGNSALKLVGDRHNLTARQRTAVMRSACADQSLERREAAKISLEGCTGKRIAIDGYNLLITIESALSGGVILTGRDGCYRDLASVHGTYRKVEETVPALTLIVRHLTDAGLTELDWLLDRPVSNSWRLKALIQETLASSPLRCNVDLVDNPDTVLAASGSPVVTSDSWILDRCGAWIDLAANIIDRHIPSAWKLDLS